MTSCFTDLSNECVLPLCLCRVFKCTLCPYTTVSQYHWRKHLRNHFPSKLHTCSQCSYFSDRKSNYIQHIRTHTGTTTLCVSVFCLSEVF